MARTITHKSIVDLHRTIKEKHLGINGFYRFNWDEINGNFRSGIGTPAILLESFSSDFENTSGHSNFNNRSMSIMILDFAGKVGDYQKQEDVIDTLETIAVDILSYLKKLNETRESKFYGMISANNFKLEKVGPIFDNMYGWNILYNIKNQEILCFDVAKWLP